MKRALYRFIQLFTLVGIPLLGALYFYQFLGQSRKELVPFKSFKFPENTLKTASGKDWIFKPRKTISVINFWATWCPPCVNEFPAMLELKRVLKDYDIEFLFVSVDDKWETVQEFQSKYNIDLPTEANLWDPEKKAANDWGSIKFPETYVLRSDGWVVEKIIGEQLWTRKSIVEYFIDLTKKYADLEKSKNPKKAKI